MAVGITPKAQPLDAFLGKLFKGLYRYYYDCYIISAPSNDKGQPISPTRQICPTWVGKAWNKVPEELVRKFWGVCGYKNIDDFQNVQGSINQSIAEFDGSRIVQIMESDGVPESITSLDDPEMRLVIQTPRSLQSGYGILPLSLELMCNLNVETF